MLDIARVLLDHGATANSEDYFGRTPLHLVAEGRYNFEQDRIRIVQLLLERSADVNAQDENNATPLHLASYNGRAAIARVLLDGGAAANLMGNQGRTPLHSVAEGRFFYSEDDGIRVAQLLLERGADVNAPDEDNKTPLHLASYYGNVEIVRVLLDGDATTHSKGNRGWTPLHEVTRCEDQYSMDNTDVLVAQLLLERGADVNASDEDNRTPLHLASYYGKAEIVRVLLDSHATTSSKGNQGWTPLHEVAQSEHYYSRNNGDVLVAQLLLERGADVNVPDDDNRTPLHLASYFGRVEMVLVLLNAGANASAKNAQGQTPLHLVSQHPFSIYFSRDHGVGVAQLLLKHGADVNAQDNNHATPKIASLLLHYGDKADAKIDQRLTQSQLGLAHTLIAPYTDTSTGKRGETWAE